MLFFFYSAQASITNTYFNFNILELSHLTWYITAYNLYSKFFLALFYLSSLFWFFFAFFWLLPLQFTLASLVFIFFYFFLFHKHKNPFYVIILYTLLPRGTHNYGLQLYGPWLIPTALTLVVTTPFKSASLGFYLSCFYVFYLPIWIF